MKLAKLQEIRGGAPARSRVAQAAESLRRAGTHAPAPTFLRVLIGGALRPRPMIEFQAKELAAVLQFAIDHPPERCREAYTVYRDHGMRYAEIAQFMGISARIVETQLARAHRVLRLQLDGWL